MIDEREITASKMWRAVSEVKRAHKINDGELNKLALMVSSCIFIIHDKKNRFQNIPYGFIELLNSLLFRKRSSNGRELSPKWEKVEGSLREFLGSASGPLWMRFSTDIVQDAAAALMESSDSLADIEYFFETAFRRHINSVNPLDFKISRKIAELASHVVPKTAQVVDHFIESGDFATLTLSKRKGNRTAYAIDVPNDDFPLRLRLAMHGINLEVEEKAGSAKNSFFLINHPKQRVSSVQSLRDFRRDSDESALEVVDRLLQGDTAFGLAFAVIPGADRTSAGYRKDMRKYIAQNHLVAVIDIPFLGLNSKKARNVSVWLLSEKRRPVENILFVNSAKILRSKDERGEDDALRFVADLIHIWDGQIDLSTSSKILTSSKEFEGLFRHEFRDGYRDVEGLCKAVNYQDLHANNWNLTASKYVFEIGRESKLPTLDSNPVLDILNDEEKLPKRIYVIGNNGEGKSLLLSELINHLGILGIPTIGLSFGLTDRFPFGHVNTPEMAPFTYVGARTTEKSVALRSTNRALFQHMKAIQTEQVRLDVFLTVMKLLGFRHSLFIVPLSYTGGISGMASDELSEIAMLTNKASENLTLLDEKPAGEFALGLMRKNTRNQIVMFEELSSGEQQLLILAIKLIANGKSGMVMLVDEPEISLHVSWQRAIPSVFEIISNKLKCSIVIATHSPIVIASAVNSQDYCFAAQNRTLVPISIKKNQSVDTVLFDDFKTYTHQTRRVHERCAAMVAKAIKRVNSEDLRSESLNLDLLSELDNIVEVIQASPNGISHEQLVRDLALVENTRAAIAEISN